MSLYVKFFNNDEEDRPDSNEPDSLTFGPFATLDTWAGDLAGNTADEDKIVLAHFDREEQRYQLVIRVTHPDGIRSYVELPGQIFDWWEACDGLCPNGECFANLASQRDASPA